MKPITKIIIFLVVAFALVLIITFAARSKVAPVTLDESPTPSASASPSTSITATVSSPTYTLADVAKHKTVTDCWTAVGDSVYNLTPFVSKHPGGVENITKICGIDGTAQFTAQHGTTANAQKTLATLKIGMLTK